MHQERGVYLCGDDVVDGEAVGSRLRLICTVSEEVCYEVGSSLDIKVPKIRNLRVRYASPVGIMFLVRGRAPRWGLL